MTLDELFDIVDCYTEEISISSPYISSPYIKDNFKDWTVTCTYPYLKDSAADQISSKLNGGIIYDNNSNHTARSSTR